MNEMMKIKLVIFITTIIAGCSVGPDYQRPGLDLPTQWKTPTNPPPSSDNILITSSTSAPMAGEQTALNPWWTIFKDATLNQLIDEAVKNNFDLASAAAHVLEAQAELNVTEADQFPTIYAAGTKERNRSSAASGRTMPGQPLLSTTHRATLNINYEIDFWGKYRRATEAARAQLLAIEANRKALRLSLIAQVIQNYFNLLALDAQLEATKTAVARGQESLRLQKIQLDAGVISAFDYQQRSAEVDTLQALLPPIQNQLGKQERILHVLLGHSPHALMETQIARDPSGLEERALASTLVPAGLPSELLLKRPDLIATEQQLIATNAQIGVARAAYFPSISLTGFLGSESSALKDLFSGPARIWNFAGNLTQPIWGGGRIRNQVAAAQARHEQAILQYRSAITQAFREVQDALGNYHAAREIVEIEKNRALSLRKFWDLVKLRYENGLASQLEVIDAERSMLFAEINRINAEKDWRAATADLYKALGG